MADDKKDGQKVPFSHEGADYQVKIVTKNKWTAALGDPLKVGGILVCIVFIFILWMRNKGRIEHAIERIQIESHGHGDVSYRRSGDVELDTVGWNGGIVIPYGCRIDWNMPTHKAPLLIFTGENQYEQAEYGFSDNLQITNDTGRVYSWKINPNPKYLQRLASVGIFREVATTAKLHYVVHPASEGPIRW